MQTLLDSLDAFRVGDAERARFYEDTLPEVRARMKTAIAYHFFRHGQHSISGESDVLCARSGFRVRTRFTPADTALFWIAEGFASPARLLSAVCAASLAGVRDLHAVFAGSPVPSLIAALELAGVENIYAGADCLLCNAYDPASSAANDASSGGEYSSSKAGRRSIAVPPSCRLCVFGPYPRLLADPASGYRVFEDRYSPIIACHASAMPFASLAHADAHFVNGPAPVGIGTPGEDASTVFEPPLEFCWPSPEPEFFVCKTESFSFEPNGESLLP